VLAGCNVVRHLLEKAQTIGHLNHRERYTLLSVFGHLGEEGAAHLHAAMAACANYDPAISDRYLARLKASPVSCNRVREWLPEAIQRVSCSCRFSLPAGAWPTPILHALPVVLDV
jgi:hypothetical protein